MRFMLRRVFSQYQAVYLISIENQLQVLIIHILVTWDYFRSINLSIINFK